jgi:hypothetical protein
MSIKTFDDLLRAAREQTEPQRLLFVFANAVLPEDSTPEQRVHFEAGQGGALEPLMSVDKTPDELGSFEALVEEAQQFGKAWAVVFVAALSGRNGRARTSKDADEPRERMISSIKAGLLRAYLPFDAHGTALVLS